MEKPKKKKDKDKEEAREVWVPDAEEGYVSAAVVEDVPGTPAVKVADSKGKEHEIERGKAYPKNPPNQDGVPDNTQLMHLHEASLLHNLRVRYARDDIYTYTAYILIALNPYKKLSIYNEDVLRQYQGKSMGVLAPHAFAVADRAYRSMKATRLSQSVIISGESGAGKTETAKIVMSYLASTGGTGAGVSMGVLERRIVECNPILEAFGNAKTLRNDNSSRFGKFTKILFDRNGHVSGASIVTYLLEKSRICGQQQNERNYHAFYFLLVGSPPELREKLSLTRPEDYHYVNQSGCIALENVNDVEEFAILQRSLTLLNFSEEEQMSLFEITAAILHLGNIIFRKNRFKEELVIENEDELTVTANLMQVPAEELRKKLLFKTITARGDTFTSPLKEVEATYSRDALAKFIYSRLFDWIVSKINAALVGEESISFIGVLDIYGFEYFEDNSFEQFCINLANEKLQQHFNHQVLRQEQEIYEREGIVCKKIQFVDNQDCIDLLEKKGTGILSILDEECRLPNGAPTNFARKVHTTHGKSNRLSAPKPKKGDKIRLARDEGFVIRHFAGEVTYNAALFLDKNNDTLNPDLAALVTASSHKLLSIIFAGDRDDAAAKGAAPARGAPAKKKSNASVGEKFVGQLAHLMENLQETVSHFIRCIKPNEGKRPGGFEGQMTLTQLRCSGMLEALLLMHEGFPTRCPYEDLYERYKDIVPPVIANLDCASFCEALFMALEVDKNEFQLGITKVFFRAGRLAFLDELRGSEYQEIAKDIADKVIRWLSRKRFRRSITSIRTMLRLVTRVDQRRAFDKLANTSLTVFLLSSTWLKRARILKRRNASARIQAEMRASWARKDFLKMRNAAILMEKMVKGWLVRKKYAPILKERKEERIRKKKEEEEELARLKAEERRLRLEAEKARVEMEKQRAIQKDEEDRQRRAREEERKAQLEREHAELARLEAQAKMDNSREELEAARKKMEEEFQKRVEEERKEQEERRRLETEAQEKARTEMRAMEEKIAALSNKIHLIDDTGGSGARSADLDLKIEVRLRSLESELKELAKKLAKEAQSRTELEKNQRHLQTTTRNQFKTLSQQLDEERTARLELEKIVLQLHQALQTGVPPSTRAGLGSPTQRPLSMSRPSLPLPTLPPTPGSGAKGDDLLGETDPGKKEKGEGSQEEDGVMVEADPNNPMAALDELKQRHQQRKKAREAVAIPKRVGAPSAKAPTAPEPILRLKKAVEEIAAHFSQTGASTARGTLGDDCKNTDIGRLVRGQLCSALVRIFWHGFKSFKLIGRYHLWDFFNKVQKSLEEVDKTSQLSLSRAIEIVNNSHELVKNNDVKFRSLICYGLNYKILHVWISLLGEEEPVVVKWFESWSFIRSPNIRAQLIDTLKPLVDFPFCMSLDFEIASWDL